MRFLLLLICGILSQIVFFDIKWQYRLLCAFLAVACFVLCFHSSSSQPSSTDNKKKFVQRIVDDQAAFRLQYSEFSSLLLKYRLEEISLRLKHDVDLCNLLTKIHGRPIKSMSDCGSFTLWSNHFILENDFKCAMAMHVALDANKEFEDLLEYPYLYKNDNDFRALLRSFCNITNSLHKNSSYSDPLDSLSIKKLSE